MIELTPAQKVAFEECMNFLMNEDRTGFVFSGVAGSGKTTVIKKINEEMDKLSLERPLVNVALTGRAVATMRAKGITAKTMTIHGLLYIPDIDEFGELVGFKKVPPYEIQERYSGILIDEASMVNSEIFADLTNTGLPLLFVGDKEQLPPIDQSGFDIMSHADVHLSEIHRQAEGNLIIQLSREIRETGVINRKYASNEIRFIRAYDVTKPFLTNSPQDVILTGTNKTRRRYNRISRVAKGFGGEYPETGEIVICLRNDVINGRPIYNGERYRVEEIVPYNKNTHKLYITNLESPDKNSLWVMVRNECWEEVSVKDKIDGYGKFTFGDSLSVWKAQGSEFDNVLFIDEDVSYFSDRRRFRYTAVTRAVKQLTIAQ